MVTDGYGLQLSGPSPWRAAGGTFLAFLAAGFVPLFPFFLPIQAGRVDHFPLQHRRSQLWSGLEILAVGGTAALLAYGMGAALHALLGQ